MEWMATVGAASLNTLAWVAGLAVVFGVAVRLMPCNPGMYWWRDLRAVGTDLTYWFVVPVATRVCRTLVMAGLALAVRVDPQLFPVRGLPLWQQCLAILLIQDVILYWIHRGFHTPAGWPFHAVHHSPTVLDWTSTSRFHPVNFLLSVLVADVAVLLLGFSPKALLVLVPLNTIYSAMVHANLNWTFGPLRYVFASPVFHRWHHTTEERGIDKNFAPTFPFLDLLFGTFFMPKGEIPEEFGNGDADFPSDFWGQFLHPFRRGAPAGAAAPGRPSWRTAGGIAVASAVVGLMAFSVFHARAQRDRDRHEGRAAVHFNGKEFDRAIAESTEALRQDPDCALAYANRAASHMQKGDLESAVADCTRAIELEPGLALAYANRAGAYLNQGDLGRAVADGTRAIELDPRLALGYANRAGAYLNQGALDRAVADCGEAIALDPRMGAAYFTRAGALFNKGDVDGSIRDWERVLELDPEAANAYANRGTAYMNKGDNRRAVADYGEALRRDPNLVVAVLNRGAALARLGDAAAALQDFSRAITLDPKLAIAYSYRGALALSAGRGEQAVVDCTRAIELDPRLALAYWTRALANGGRGNRQQAQADRKKALELDPSLGEP